MLYYVHVKYSETIFHLVFAWNMYGKSVARAFLGAFFWVLIPFKWYQNTSGCGTAIEVGISLSSNTNVNLKVVLERLGDFSVANVTAMVTMQILHISYKITDIKNYWSWICATIILAIFIPNNS